MQFQVLNGFENFDQFIEKNVQIKFWWFKYQIKFNLLKKALNWSTGNLK